VSNINHNQTACSVEYAMAERYRELIREMLSNHGLNFNMWNPGKWFFNIFILKIL
jgi:hypothetical protein